MNGVYIMLITILLMEFVAWFLHKYVMHGFLWILHKDHHGSKKKIIERNDIFAFIFVIPSIFLIWKGTRVDIDYRLWLGLGITSYGVLYFAFHDVLFHERIKIFSKFKNRYFTAVINAHRDHHQKGKNFGFLFMFPWRYFLK